MVDFAVYLRELSQQQPDGSEEYMSMQNAADEIDRLRMAHHCFGGIIDVCATEVDRLKRERDEAREAAIQCFRGLLRNANTRLAWRKLFVEAWPWLDGK
jgi:hypothetical protein